MFGWFARKGVTALCEFFGADKEASLIAGVVAGIVVSAATFDVVSIAIDGASAAVDGGSSLADAASTTSYIGTWRSNEGCQLGGPPSDWA